MNKNGNSVALKLVVCHQNVAYFGWGNYVGISAQIMFTIHFQKLKRKLFN